MHKFIIGLMAFFSVSVQASSQLINGPLDAEFFDAEIHQEMSYFDSIGRMVAAGSLPDLTKIVNVAWAGRCFTVEAPYTPTNAGLIVRKASSSDVGPIGNSVKRYEYMSYWKKNKSPNYYDNLSMAQVLQETDLNFKPLIVTSEELLAPRSSPNFTTSIKFSAPYLVEELYAYKADTDVGPVGQPRVKEPKIRCYYFIPQFP